MLLTLLKVAKVVTVADIRHRGKERRGHEMNLTANVSSGMLSLWLLVVAPGPVCMKRASKSGSI
jgi:hypothetical protein